MLAPTHKNSGREKSAARFEVDSEHPKIHGPRASRLRVLCRQHRWAIVGTLSLLIAILVVHRTYAATFLVDDILEIKEIRGLYTSEKMTIRTIAPADIKDLKAFVEHYTICPNVAEIRVVWWESRPAPPSSVFTFTKAHSTVVFDRIDGTFSCDQKEFVTPSLILLDADVFVECADIKYLGEVFQSTTDALVGYFPRLHKKISDFEYEFLGWGSVVWNKAYSILLSSALMIDTKLYNSVCDKSEVSVQVQAALAKDPQCFDVLFSVWVAHRGGNPPVWVPTAPAVRQIGAAATPWSKVSSAERSRCLSMLAQITGVKELPSAVHKAADARYELYW